MKKTLFTFIAVLGSAGLCYGHLGIDLFAAEFPDGSTPSIDGNISEWAVIPAIPYEVGPAEYSDVVYSDGTVGEMDLSDLSVRVKTGWNDTSDRLYFMAEVFDDVHNTDREDLSQFWTDDAWEIDIEATHDPRGGQEGQQEYTIHGLYNFAFPPLEGNWGQFIPEFEWRQDPDNGINWGAAWRFEGEEFAESTYFYEVWIRPWDFAPETGVIDDIQWSDLIPDKVIAASWSFGDSDEPNPSREHFWSISPVISGMANNDLYLVPLDASIDFIPTAVESDSWGRIKSQFD